ncbi:peptidoglycan-binding protein [Longimicrobium sp.]|uniref:peptidoglycan-binding protein n=1 Tax=Longimicrobium sp. TaxID=2029185 RepID=UPI002C927380|nr:peptidoglycan-binding protein [Longimicrobium sp.]HSU16300.1 peptidoglycan-binding protein [Longimicrobium sp.]
MTFKLTWLPRVLKDAGLKVALVDGWEERGRGDVGTIRGVICHHTEGSRTGNMPSLKLLIHGRSDLPGPLAQLGLGRDGTFYVIAAGRCNHAGKGEWQKITTGNSSFIGIEAENTGSIKDFPWPAVQMDAYQRGVAAILAHVGSGAEFCAAHREYALPKGRKVDPIFDMTAFRASVAAFIKNPAPALIPKVETGGAGRATLRRGDTGALVKQVQAKLGIDSSAGTFGPKTEAAVREFQRDHGMVPDGIVGPKTWAALDAFKPAPAAIVVPAAAAAGGGAPPAAAVPLLLVPEATVEPNVAKTPPLPLTTDELPLAEAHAELGRVTGTAVPVGQWGPALSRAVQRSLAELYLLNPADDVDGNAGPRTQNAWSLFRAAAGVGGGAAIDQAAARELIKHSSNRAGLIGTPLVKLEPDFAYRRNQRTANRQASAAAIIRAAKAQGLSRAQIAYVLATAEHESDRFATLEEYASGAAYEGRADLGNTHAGDGKRFKGRGYVQLTGRNNYTAYAKRTGIKLVELPVIPMNWAALSVFVIVDGMMRGAYTGRRLDEFVNKDRQDFVNARRVVNGTDQKEKIAQQARDWLSKLD